MKPKVINMEKLMNIGNVLGRSEMRKIMAGSGQCYVTCCNCNNSTCQGYVDDCDTGVLQICGPGYAGSGGPCATCVC